MSLLDDLWLPTAEWSERELVCRPRTPSQQQQTRPLLELYAKSLDEAFLKVSKLLSP
jgi:hypothetical protein